MIIYFGVCCFVICVWLLLVVFLVLLWCLLLDFNVVFTFGDFEIGGCWYWFLCFGCCLFCCCLDRLFVVWLEFCGLILLLMLWFWCGVVCFDAFALLVLLVYCFVVLCGFERLCVVGFVILCIRLLKVSLLWKFWCLLLIGLVVMFAVWVVGLWFVLFCCLCLFKCSLFALMWCWWLSGSVWLG